MFMCKPVKPVKPVKAFALFYPELKDYVRQRLWPRLQAQLYADCHYEQYRADFELLIFISLNQNYLRHYSDISLNQVHRATSILALYSGSLNV